MGGLKLAPPKTRSEHHQQSEYFQTSGQHDRTQHKFVVVAECGIVGTNSAQARTQLVQCGCHRLSLHSHQ